MDNSFNALDNPVYHQPYLFSERENEPITSNRSEVLQPVELPNIPLSDATTPGGEDLDRAKEGRMPRFRNLLDKLKRNKDKNKGDKFSTTGMFDYLPEMVAAGLAMDDYPIFTAKAQPKYMQNEVMNVQPALNRTFSQAQPLVEGVTGNPSIDNARANQTLANVYSADNEMLGQKFNFDTQNRQQVSNSNVQTENQFNQFNTQNAIGMADRMAQRKHNKNLEINRITNSAYAKSNEIQKEKRAMNAFNKLYLNRLQVDANGNPIFSDPTDLYNAAQLTGQDPMGLLRTMNTMDDERRKAILDTENKANKKTARKNDGLPVSRNGGKIKSKYKINR